MSEGCRKAESHVIRPLSGYRRHVHLDVVLHPHFEQTEQKDGKKI